MYHYRQLLSLVLINRIIHHSVSTGQRKSTAMCVCVCGRGGGGGGGGGGVAQPTIISGLILWDMCNVCHKSMIIL